jgi:hypothetical protein
MEVSPLVMLLALFPVLTIGAVMVDLLFDAAPRRGKWPFPTRHMAHSRLRRLENQRRVTVAQLSRYQKEHFGTVNDDDNTHRA